MRGWQVAVLLGCLTACGPRDIERRTEVLRAPTPIELRNFTVLLVDPGPGGVQLEWTGHNLRTGDAFRPPYEELLLQAEGEETLVTTDGAGNRELVVDGVLHRFDPTVECLRVRPGEDPEVVPLPVGQAPPGVLEPAR